MSDQVLIALITTFGSVIVALLGVLLNKVKQVHTLANNRLTEALDSIALLQRQLGVAEAQKDERRKEL